MSNARWRRVWLASITVAVASLVLLTLSLARLNRARGGWLSLAAIGVLILIFLAATVVAGEARGKMARGDLKARMRIRI